MNKKIGLLIVMSLPVAACSSMPSMPSWMGGREDEKPKLQGERQVALAVDKQLVPDSDVKGSNPVLPNVIANTDWPQHSGIFTAKNGNIAGGKFANGDFGSKNSADAGGGYKFSNSLIPRPIVAGGKVFAMDAVGIISAHDAADIGKILWKSKIVADPDKQEVIGGGLAASDGILYATTGQGQVAAINIKDGSGLWQKNFSVPIRSSPRVSGDHLIVVTIDSQAYALSTKTGDILWNHRGINETSMVMNSVSPTIAGNDVLVPYASGELFAISMADGKELWADALLQNRYTQASSAFTGIGGDPTIDGEFVFATGSNGITVAINIPSGKRVWQRNVASLNTPWLAGDELFILTSDNILVDFVKYDGKIRWTTALASYENSENRQGAISWHGPVLVDGKLFIVGSNGKMVVVSAASGRILETKSIPNNIVTSPIVAEGRMYLVGQDATLYSFQ